jgi:DNA-binding NarL/FixJ family response regulator
MCRRDGPSWNPRFVVNHVVARHDVVPEDSLLETDDRPMSRVAWSRSGTALSMTSIRVLVVDDHEMFAESVSRLLAREVDIEIVSQATTMNGAVHAAEATQPDVAIIDFRLPDGDGIDTVARIRAVSPGTQLLMLTGSADERLLLAAIQAGCCGFVTKDKAFSELVRAVRLAHVGEVYLPPQMLAGLLPRLGGFARGIGSDLSPREREVLSVMSEGLSNQAIAERLFLSVNTVRNHIQNILTKLHAHSKLEAVATATREGLLGRRAGP